ncbi:MAG: ribonuclease R, partial [Acidobacteria bacterium]
MISDSAILKKIERQPKRTAGFKQLVREMGVHGDARRELSERLKRLVSGKQLVQVDSDRYAIPQAAAGKNLIVGRLSMHRDGFGFVIPDATSLDERLKARLSGDIFIPPPAVGSAMHGDRVLVEVTALRPDGRAEGRIVRPLHRAHSTVVGIFHYGNRYNYVTPLDRKISQQIIIPKGLELPEKGSEDGTRPDKGKRTKTSVHRVLEEEVARTRPDNLENVVVDVEITDWP